MPSEIADETELPADEESVPLSSDGEDVSEAEQDVPDWLQDLGEDMPAAESEDAPPLVFEDQPAAEEQIQEPGLDAGPGDTETEAVQESQPADDGEQIPGVPGSEPEEFLLESEFPESIPDWLSEVSPEEIPEEVAEAEAELDIVRAEIPVWLRKMEAQHKAELEAAGEVDRIEDLELEAEFTELSGEDVPSWLMSAMEPEMPAEVDESAEVEDISEVFETKHPVGIDEFGLESSAAEEIEADKADELEDVVDDLEFEELQDELAPEAAVPETLIEADKTAEEIAGIAEEPEDLLEPETEVESDLESEETAEEIETVEGLEAQAPEEEHEGIGVPGLAAAGAVAAHLLDEEDTQPVAVGEEPEITSDLEAEDIVEGPIVEDEAELPEVADEIERQIPEAEGEIIPQDELEEAEVSAIESDAPLSGEEQDAAMAWLESLAAKQGAAEEEPALAGVTAGILAGDEEPGEDDEEAEPVSAGAPEEPSEWVPEVLAEEELAPDAEDKDGGEDIAIEPEPIEIEEEPDVVEELAAAAEVDLDQVEAEETPEEIPDWLSGLAEEQEAAVEPETTDWTPDMLAEEVEEPSAAVEGPPGEKLDLNAASLAQLEKIPGIGFIHAQNIVNHRAASGSFTDLEQLGDVEGLTPEIVADLEDYLTVEVVKEVSTTESEIPELQEAWNNISEGNIEGAVDQYTELINQDQYLDEVIRDLQSALGKYPSDSSLYQSLGDAYMRTNMLQEALDAYNRAEDLI
jgi:tetratricopeptide (TPR) repeat protein